jgi:hypothetical protein
MGEAQRVVAPGRATARFVVCESDHAVQVLLVSTQNLHPGTCPPGQFGGESRLSAR